MSRGLRVRTLVLFVVVMLGAGVVSGLLGWRVISDTRAELGLAIAREAALRAHLRVEAKIGREIALARRMAESSATLDWMRQEADPVLNARFQREAEGFRTAFADHKYFVGIARSGHFYYADDRERQGELAELHTPDQSWFSATLARPNGVLINVDHDARLKVTDVWINVAVRDGEGTGLGVIGTGIGLKRFLTEVLESTDAGVVSMLVDANGAIFAHPDMERMAFALANGAETDKTLYNLAAHEGDAQALRETLAAAHATPNEVFSVVANVDGGRREVAMAWEAELGVAVVSLVDPYVVADFRTTTVAAVAASVALILFMALLAAALGFDRLVLRPLAVLTKSVRHFATGDYAAGSSLARADEIGELARAFDDMAARVRANAEHLERQVAVRTSELAQAHGRIAEAHRALTDSIDYARLIQRAVLPGRGEAKALPEGCSVLWRPREVLGGDLYMHRARDDLHLFGVVDCAGHGVPGACMTMAAHAALQVAIEKAAWDDPAAILTRVDALMRETLPDDGGRGAPATSMDLGLMLVDRVAGQVVFSGARIDLFWSEPGSCSRVSGARRGMNDRRRGVFFNTVVKTAPGRSFLLTTDGLLDQTGGDRGFGFGAKGFQDWAAKTAELSPEYRMTSLQVAFDAHRGERRQLDDLTVLAIRPDLFEDSGQTGKEHKG